MKKGVLKKGNKVILRDACSSDISFYKKWMQKGEWKEFDAPWENFLDRSEKELSYHY